ncbi:MAG: dephospho-CoA kinase [Opitutaceae bacterium]|nr:dephospho-CoA kinase [Opitutaceae bacterium]
MSQAKTRVNHSVCIGVTGGMGCGKSTVSKLLAEQGFILIDSDALIRDKILHLPEVVAEAVNKYSDKILNSEGKIDRSRLATKVFANDADLRWLEELTHPRLFDEWRAIMRPDPKGRWVIEVPLLFEKQLENWFDFIVCVASSPDKQLARLEQRGIPRPLAEQRISKQLLLAKKIELSDFVLWNDGPISFLKDQVKILSADLQSRL